MTTAPFPFTRRFFEPEEVIISSCTYCFATVAESDDEAVLEALELEHSCSESLDTSSIEEEFDSELLAAV